jgi:hypothetical protein
VRPLDVVVGEVRAAIAARPGLQQTPRKAPEGNPADRRDASPFGRKEGRR